MLRKQTFWGGVHPAGRKELSSGAPLEDCPPPREVVIPLLQHIGKPCTPLVKAGDHVDMGQKIGDGEGLCVPVHASVSGTVKAVEPRSHPSGQPHLAVVIENDFQNTYHSAVPPCADTDALDADALIRRIREAGLVGMGGATFPTDIKANIGKVETLIANACECEPYITADDALLCTDADRAIRGLRLLRQLLKPRRAGGGGARRPRAARRRQALPADRRVGCRRRRSRPAAARPPGFAHEGQEDRERGFPGQGGQEAHRCRRGYQFTDGRTYREPHARLIRAQEMNNIFVYIENEGGKAAEVCLELLTKGRELATTLGVKLEAVVLGENLAGIEHELAKYGADTVWIADDKVFAPFRTLPHTAVMCGLIEQEKPQIVLFGATCNGRDFAPRVSSALYSGLTADCTQLVIGDHKDAKSGREYKDLLYQIRPAFGGNIIATIVNPDNRPQMATVREGVMRREYAAKPGAGEVKKIEWQKFVKDADLAVKIIDREIAESKIDIKGAGVIVAGGYGMGSKENFDLVFELADVLGAEVGASRAAVDAGFADHARQVGQTGVTVRPKLYIACGISGQIQHTAGMDGSAMVISINTDPEAPINKIADYAITGDVNEVIPKMIKYYKQNSK